MEKNFNIAFIDILRFIWRGLLNALIAGAAVALLVFVVSKALPPTYEARSSVIVATDNTGGQVFDVQVARAPTLNVSAYRKAALSSPNIQKAMQALGIEKINTKTIEKFRRTIKIHVEDTKNSSIIDIIASAKNRKLAQDKANIVAQTMITWDKQRYADSLRDISTALEHQIAILDSQIEAMRAQGASNSQIQRRLDSRNRQQDQLALARAQSSSPPSLLTLIEPALLPDKPVSPKPMLNAIISFLLTSLVSYGLLHLYESISSDSLNKLSEKLGLPVLASFPKLNNSKLPKESTNFLRTNLLNSSGEERPKVILVASPKDGEGKTTVAISLAESFVRNDNNTLIVDANLRHPGIAKHYKLLASRLGHTSIETWLGQPRQAKGVVRMPIGEQSLFIIPSFGNNPDLAEQLNKNLAEALESWKKQYDIIIIDSPAILKVADALAVTPFATDTLLVVDQQKSGPKQLKAAVDILKRSRARLSGIILTNAKKQDIDLGYAVEVDSINPLKQSGLKIPKFKNKPKADKG